MIRRRRAAAILIAALLGQGRALAGERGAQWLPRDRPGPAPPTYLRLEATAERDSLDTPAGTAPGDTLAAAASALRERLWEARSEKGARVGAIAGGVGGAALLVLIVHLGEGLCDAATCDPVSDAGWVGLAGFGGAIGAAMGGLFGGRLGATIPARKEGDLSPEPPGSRRFIASFTVTPGIALLGERQGFPAEFMLKGSFLAQLTPWVAIGPELTRSELAGGFTAVEGAVQVGPSWRALYPYLTGDLGLHSWDTGIDGANVKVVGEGIGGGVAWASAAGRWRLGVEGRYQWTPQHVENPEYHRFMFAGGTARVSW